MKLLTTLTLTLPTTLQLLPLITFTTLFHIIASKMPFGSKRVFGELGSGVSGKSLLPYKFVGNSQEFIRDAVIYVLADFVR